MGLKSFSADQPEGRGGSARDTVVAVAIAVDCWLAQSGYRMQRNGWVD